MKKLFILFVLLLTISGSVSAQETFYQKSLDKSFLNEIYNRFIGASNPPTGSIDTLNVLYNCFIKGEYGKVGSCYSNSNGLSVSPYRIWTGEEYPEDKKDTDDTRSGRIKMDIVDQPDNRRFLVYSTPSFTVKAVDDRDLDDNQKKFYGPNSYVRLWMEYPYSGRKLVANGLCDRQTLKECSTSSTLTGSLKPTISGTYTLTAKAKTVDGATESITETYTAYASGLPPQGKPDLGGSFAGWEANWTYSASEGDVKEKGYKLEFSRSRSNEVVLMDTGEYGFCGSSYIEKTVTLSEGESRTVEFDYSVISERNAAPVGVWWLGNAERKIEPDQSKLSKSGTWKVTVENQGFTNELTGTLKIGIAKKDEICSNTLIRETGSTRFTVKNFRYY